MRDLPQRARLYVAAVIVVALTTLAISVTRVDDFYDVAVFAVLFALASAFARVQGQSVSISVGFIVGLGAVVVLGPSGAAVVGCAVLAAGNVGQSLPLIKRTFNAAVFVIAAAAAGIVYLITDGPVGSLEAGAFPRVLLPLAAAAMTYFAANTLLVGVVIALTTQLALRRVLSGPMGGLAFGYLGYGFLGLLLAQLYYEMGPVSAAFLLVPLLVARSAFANYAELREAYDSTVRALCQAVETKDYYTRGHSERVGTITELIAREWGMREDRVQVIRVAGMLHDVGKLGVPTKVLQKQGKLNQLEFEAIKLHPMRGYEMLCEIDFLGEALDGVVHHHERLDGRGYPKGLIGDEIPEFARIIMVADAFDSMTSTRSYREAKSVESAVAELRRCEGMQFDPRAVDCLVQALTQVAWEPTPEDFHGEQVTREGLPIAAEEGSDGRG